MVALEVLRDRLRHAVAVVHPEEELPHSVVAEELPDVVEALGEVAFLHEAILIARVVHEGLEVAPMLRGVAGELFHLAAHLGGVLEEVEDEPVLEEVPPVRRDRFELHEVLHPLPGPLEETPEILRQGEDRRTEVEAEAVDLPEVQLPADLGVLFHDLHVEAFGTQRDRRGDASQAGADHNGRLRVPSG